MDGVVVAALVVLGSIGVGKAGEWLGSPGAGLSFCVVLGVFGIIFFVFRILFETKYIDIEQKEAVGAKVKQSKLSAKSGKIAFNIKNAIVLLMTIAIIATVITGAVYVLFRWLGGKYAVCAPFVPWIGYSLIGFAVIMVVFIVVKVILEIKKK